MADALQDWLLDPTALLFLISLVTVLAISRRQRQSPGNSAGGRRVVMMLGWLSVFLVCSAPSIVNPLLTTLEEQYPDSLICEAGSHLVMLGGGVDSRVSSPGAFERMSRSTMARATATSRIAISEPALRLVVAGGALKDITEADVVASYWIALGIDDERIIREGRSSNTRENALNVAQLLSGETLQGPVRLVTSALHMPRALRAFRRVLDEQGIEVCPVSVDREALTEIPLWSWLPQTTALVKFDKWLHEIAALAIYRLRGWI